MAAVESLIVVDVLQTLDMNRPHPGHHYWETNPLLGEHPSNARIIATGAAGGVAAAALWLTLPERVRWVVPLFVGIAEGAVVANSARIGLRVCIWGCSP